MYIVFSATFSFLKPTPKTLGTLSVNTTALTARKSVWLLLLLQEAGCFLGELSVWWPRTVPHQLVVSASEFTLCDLFEGLPMLLTQELSVEKRQRAHVSALSAHWPTEIACCGSTQSQLSGWPETPPAVPALKPGGGGCWRTASRWSAAHTHPASSVSGLGHHVPAKSGAAAWSCVSSPLMASWWGQKWCTLFFRNLNRTRTKNKHKHWNHYVSTGIWFLLLSNNNQILHKRKLKH